MENLWTHVQADAGQVSLSLDLGLAQARPPAAQPEAHLQERGRGQQHFLACQTQVWGDTLNSETKGNRFAANAFIVAVELMRALGPTAYIPRQRAAHPSSVGRNPGAPACLAFRSHRT